MPKNTVSILIPKTVKIKDSQAREIRKALAELTVQLTEAKKLDEDTAHAFIDVLSANLPPLDRDFLVEELIEVILNNGPAFKGGTKVMAMTFRIQAAFEGAQEGKIVELSAEAHEALKKWFDDPDYAVMDQQKGKAETVKGWPISAYLARQAYPYIKAICEPLTDEQLADLQKLALPPPQEP